MITLSASLLASQKSGGDALYKVTFTKSGFTTRTYGCDTTNRIISVRDTVDDWLQTAEVTVDNRDGNLTALNLIGYQAIIYYGYKTSAGDEYDGTAVFKVIAQRFESIPGDLLCVFSLAGKGNQMAEDKAKAIKKKGTATSTSAGKLVNTSGAFALSDVSLTVHNTTDNTFAKVTAFISTSQLALSADIMANGEAYSILGDYQLGSDDTSTTKVLITALLGATMPPFAHCEVITLAWELTAYQEDELANKFAPADEFRVSEGETRLDKLKELLKSTGLDGRFEGDGYLHIFQTFARVWTLNSGIDLNEITKPTIPSDWVANTAYSLNARRKPTTQNGFYYVCSVAGTSHATTEPAWPLQDGLTVDDGTVTWTCRDTNYIYTCLRAGVTDATEPVWPYTKDTGIVDGSVAWGLQYTYDYSDAETTYSSEDAFQLDAFQQDAFQTEATVTQHNFWQKGLRKSLVVPNKIIAESRMEHEVQYSGSATEPVSYALLPKEQTVRLSLASNAEADDIALAMIDRVARDSESGNGYAPLNIGQEIHDYILTTDSKEGDACRGRVRTITRYARPGVFRMTFGFASRLAKSPMGIIPPSMLEMLEPIPDWANAIVELMQYNDKFLQARLQDLTFNFDTFQAKIEAWVESIYYRTAPVIKECLANDTDLVTGDGKGYVDLPLETDLMNLVGVCAIVSNPSADVVATIQIYNETTAGDMLSTKITIDVNETHSATAAVQPVVDPDFADVGGIDRLRIDCDLGETVTEWAALTAYVIDNKLRPTFNNQNGHKYNCTTLGTSAATEPTWPTGTGATVTDGTVVWTENGGTLQGLTLIFRFRKP